MNIKFKDLRKYISVIDRVSICMRETLNYDNYRFIGNVPDKYNDYYVYGIGIIDSEFSIEEAFLMEFKDKEVGNGMFISKCIEIMLSEKPKEEFPSEGTCNEYAYVAARFDD